MVPPMLSKWLPLAADPFPPTHKAGSEFEGFFIRLQSHSGRSQSSHSTASTSISSRKGKKRTPAKDSPSRIPRLAKSSSRTPVEAGVRRRNRSSSTSSSSSSSASSSSHADPPSPTPGPRRTSSSVLPPTRTTGHVSPKTRSSISVLSDIDPVFASPESLLPPSAPSFTTNPFSGKANSTGTTPNLPTSSPGDLILVVCELQSAPIDQRICIYLRWIVHGEESMLYQKLHAQEAKERREERLPENAKGKAKEGKGQSFEIVKYIPAWQLKVADKVGVDAVQPFRIDLPSTLDDGIGSEGGLGFMQVTPDGKLVVDITLPNPNRGGGGGTRVRVRSTKHVPWHPLSSSSTKAALGSKGPEGWIQLLGLILPLHWYVHSTSAPALFSIEHTVLSSSPHTSQDRERGQELENAVAAGRGSLHVEKNWGQAFPTGWIWLHGASPLPDASIPSSLSSASSPAPPQARLSLAGGSILGLTAFLVGIHIKQNNNSKKRERVWNWNFTPPFALGPQISFSPPSSSPNAGGGERVHYGPGLKMTRNFHTKTFSLEVWDLTRWASIQVSGPEQTFATQIPGPCKGGWTPAYCHHSYRCSAKIVLYQRSKLSLLTIPVKAAWSPVTTIRGLNEFWRKEEGNRGEEGWKRMGWDKVVEVELADRVALEFGGDFAK